MYHLYQLFGDYGIGQGKKKSLGEREKKKSIL